MRPHISIATLCHEVVSFPGGGQSLLGIVEGLPLPPPPAAPPYVFHLTIVCLLHFSSAAGAVSVRAAVKDSTGRHFTDDFVQLLEVGPRDVGRWLVGPIELRVEDPGVYWLEVTIDGERAARTPVHIRMAH